MTEEGKNPATDFHPMIQLTQQLTSPKLNFMFGQQNLKLSMEEWVEKCV